MTNEEETKFSYIGIVFCAFFVGVLLSSWADENSPGDLFGRSNKYFKFDSGDCDPYCNVEVKNFGGIVIRDYKTDFLIIKKYGVDK